MDSIIPNTPEGWERYVKGLLSIRYSSNFVAVPDGHGGDFGLEGFTRDGHAYQCYFCDEPVSVRERFEKQQTKIRKDLKKFVDNSQHLTKLLGLTKITQWNLVVPKHDSALLVQYAQKKAAEIMDLGLPYVGDTFVVNILTDDSFPQERHILTRKPEVLARTVSIVPGDDAIQCYEKDKPALVSTLDRKINKLKTLETPSRRSEFRKKILEFYLAGQNSLEELHRKWPTIYEDAIHCKAVRERHLSAECMIAEGTAAETLNQAINRYRDNLASSVPGIDGETAETLVYEAVADWMLRCPLSFGETDHV